jgi:hypothetical protein
MPASRDYTTTRALPAEFEDDLKASAISPYMIDVIDR